MTNYVTGPMTKAEKLRRAAKVCWWIGTILTWNFIRTVLPTEWSDPVVRGGIAAVCALGLQYLLTMIEATLLSGMLPAPWNITWSHSTEAILSIGAFGCFFMDWLLNLGGVYSVTSKLESGMGDVSAIGISGVIINVIIVISTIFFAALFALGSEMLEALAERYEGRRPQTVQWEPTTQPMIDRNVKHSSLPEPTVSPASIPQQMDEQTARIARRLRESRNKQGGL